MAIFAATRSSVRSSSDDPVALPARMEALMPTMSAAAPASSGAGGAAPDQHRRVRGLDRFGQPVQAADLIMLAHIGQWLRGEEPFEYVDCLGEPVHPDAGRIERDVRRRVVAGHPARTQTDLDPAAGQHVERCQRLVQQCGVAVIVAQHERQHPQVAGRFGSSGHGDHRFHHPALGEMVGDRHRRIPEVFDPAELGPPGGYRVSQARHRRAEAELVRHGPSWLTWSPDQAEPSSIG